MILVDASDLAASRPGRPLFADLDVTVSSGDRMAIVGINGCGKSTLLGILAGEVEPEAGIVRRGRGVDVAVLDQSPDLHGSTMREALHHGGLAQDWEVEAVADRLGLGDGFDTPTDVLSGGQAKRVALARALVSDAALLVLDEPTNHLDIDAIAWLEDRLASHTGALLLVTHDRHFLDRVTTRILELDGGRGHVHDGGYSGYLESRARRREQSAAAESKRRNLARAELEWLRRGAPARTSKPKARIESATKLIAGGPDAEARAGDLPLHANTPRLGDRVVELHGVGHGFGGDSLFSDVELLLDRRERLGVVGANGTGKSTLLEIMAGRLTPDEGTVTIGSTARIAVYDQQGRELDPTTRVRDAVVGDRVPDHTDAALMEAFWFDEDAQWAPIGTLSGGERRRLQLLLTLATRPNVLFLDEPTNDLDVDTLRQLEDFLELFAGAVVVVSHDRAFLERVVADVVVLGDGRVARRPGGYAAYEDERRAARRSGRSTLRTGPASSGTASSRRTASVGSGDPAPSPATGSSSSTSPSSSTAGRASPSSAGRSTVSPSTLRHRLREAEREHEAAMARAQGLREALSAVPGAGGTPPVGHEEMAQLGTDLAQAEADLVVAEEKWLALADEVESRGLDI